MGVCVCACVSRPAGAGQMRIRFLSILSVVLSVLKSSERLLTGPHTLVEDPLGGPASQCPEKECNLLRGQQLSKPRLICLPVVLGESARGQEGQPGSVSQGPRPLLLFLPSSLSHLEPLTMPRAVLPMSKRSGRQRNAGAGGIGGSPHRPEGQVQPASEGRPRRCVVRSGHGPREARSQLPLHSWDVNLPIQGNQHSIIFFRTCFFLLFFLVPPALLPPSCN